MLMLTGDAKPLTATTLLPIEARDLMVARKGRTLVDTVSLTLDGDGLVAIMGPNGAGKSLVLRLMAGLIAPDSGRVTWAGAAPDHVRSLALGFVLQKPVMLRRSALANVEYPLKLRGVAARERATRVRQQLAAAGLLHVADTPARLLSGGEQRRLAIARALVTEPEILFLDEPAANLDPHATAAIEAQIASVRDNGTPVVMVTHHRGQARRLASRIVFMAAGRIIEQATASDFFKTPTSPQARAFLAGELVL